jgi:siroheme synthase
VVENGASEKVRHFKSRLDDLPALIVREAIAAPSIILIGEVAALAREDDIRKLAEQAA